MRVRSLKPAAIIGGVRIPFARSNTIYTDIGNLGLSIKAVAALVDKYGLAGAELGEVALGAVLKHARDWNLAREVTLASGLSPLTPAITQQRACGTSLDTVITIANKIATGQIEVGIGGGSDTTSDAPIAVSTRLRQRLLAANRAKTLGQRIGALIKGFSPRELVPEFPGVVEPRTGKSMGEHCEEMARAWGIGRVEQDQLALASHQKTAAAYERGFYDDLVCEFRGVRRDNNLRTDSTLEKLATLKPAFDRHSGNGTLTAGNSTPLTDGAAAVLLASEDYARARLGDPGLSHARQGRGGGFRRRRGPVDGTHRGGRALA